MLVLAPAACIMSGIALSGAFDVLTRSLKFQLPGTSEIFASDVSLLFQSLLKTPSDYWRYNFLVY